MPPNHLPDSGENGCGWDAPFFAGEVERLAAVTVVDSELLKHH